MVTVKKLIQIITKLEFYTKLDKKIDAVLNAELDIEDWSNEVCSKKDRIEDELSDLKIEMNLSDEGWD